MGLTLVDVEQRAPDVVFDSSLLGSVGEVLALLDLKLHVHLLPVVGHCEHGRSPRHRLDQGRLIIEIGLCTC